MFLHNLKVAERNLLKYRGSAVIGIVGLTVGLLCFVLCICCARLLIGVDQAFPNSERIVEVMIKDRESGRYFSGSPANTVRTLQDKFPGKTEYFTAVTYPWNFNVSFESRTGKQLTYLLNTIETDRNFRRVFSCHLIAGNWEQIERQKNAVVLTERTAKRIFGDQSPLGQVFHPNEFTRRAFEIKVTPEEYSGVDYIVMGVIEDLPVNASFSFLYPLDALMFNDEYGLLTNQEPQDGYSGCVTYALLYSGITCADLNLGIDTKRHAVLVGDELYVPEFLPSGKYFRDRYMTISSFYLGVGSLILLVALLNFFTFLIGNFFNRLKEYQLRKGLGGEGRHLFGLLYTEIMLYFIPVLVLVFCLLELTYSRLDFGWYGHTFNFELSELYKQLLFYWICGSGLCAVICWGISIWMSRKYIRGELRGTGRTSSHWGRNIMLGLQLVVCTLFLTGSLAMYKQLHEVECSLFSGLSKGEKENIVEVNFNDPHLKGRETFLIERLSGIPEVIDVLQAEECLMSVRRRGMSVRGQTYFEYCILPVGSNFMSFLNMPLLSGQIFRHPGQGIADPKMAGWVGNDPLNQYLENINEPGFEITGLTEELPNIYNEGTNSIIWIMSEHPKCCYLKVYPGTREIVEKKIGTLLYEWLPESVLPQIKTLQQVVEESTEFYNKIQSILSFFAIVCIVITILGIYSAITIDTEKRRKEMAIRKINGASAGVIVRLFIRLYAGLLGIALLITFPLLWWGIQEWLEDFTIRFNYGIGFWLTIILLMVAILAITIAWKIREIILENPVEVLKNE